MKPSGIAAVASAILAGALVGFTSGGGVVPGAIAGLIVLLLFRAARRMIK